MLRSVKDLQGLTIHATDGEIGKAEEFLFDDRRWTIRYLVVNTGGDPHLRSTREVTGYRISAADGDLGHVDDLLMDDESWAIRYLVVDTRNWWPGKKVLLPPPWIQRVSWIDQEVEVNLTRAQ